MKDFKIYTAGKMSGLSYEEQMAWRRHIEYAIKGRTSKAITFIHPPLYYHYDRPEEYQSEREVMEWDLSQIRDSDIVVVNLAGINDSTGTHFELGVTNSINNFGSKHIHVIGIGDPSSVYSWIRLSLHRCETTYEDAADYIARYLLV